MTTLPHVDQHVQKPDEKVQLAGVLGRDFSGQIPARWRALMDDVACGWNGFAANPFHPSPVLLHQRPSLWRIAQKANRHTSGRHCHSTGPGHVNTRGAPASEEPGNSDFGNVAHRMDRFKSVGRIRNGRYRKCRLQVRGPLAERLTFHR